MRYALRDAGASCLDLGAAVRDDVRKTTTTNGGAQRIGRHNSFRYTRGGEGPSVYRHGRWIVAPVRRLKPSGIDYSRLEVVRRRLGIEKLPSAEAEAWIADFENEALSLEVLGLDKEEAE